MDKDLIEKYKNEMLRIYRKSPSFHKMEQPDVPVQNTELISEPEVSNTNVTASPVALPTNADSTKVSDYGENGRLLGIITTIGNLYPVPNAKVSIFTGDYGDEMQVIDTDRSDLSGKTKPFLLPAPPREFSLQAGSAQIPYELYNMLVEADGYIKNIHLNIPVFRGVTSLQNSSLVVRPTDKPNAGPIIYDESLTYDL